SKVNNIEQLYTSLCISVSRSFSDIVRKTIDNDISTKWRLKTLSEKLNLSEVTIRKKLENENTNFYRILLDARMQKAARLVLDSDTHINKVSYAVGMSSVSYFIKLFSDYYGLTPKQFHLKYKHKTLLNNSSGKVIMSNDSMSSIYSISTTASAVKREN
ncbi:helix-turn-helix transcriptional regulator, partial [Salmonella enterica]|uniref:helix-turn-helix transcriptional regulator n=1 Tax=Salmonella enterica TaxID=28901 RepID=UPI001E4D463F